MCFFCNVVTMHVWPMIHLSQASVDLIGQTCDVVEQQPWRFCGLMIDKTMSKTDGSFVALPTRPALD